MNKIKVLFVFGTRPEAIKMAPLVKEIESDSKFESIVCVTGQHREMLDSVLTIFSIEPHYDLNIMKHGQGIVDIASRVLYGVDNVIKQCLPDIVLVHGDTSTTLNSALAAFYNQIPIGHVEAGLRSNDLYSPFPEEGNRKLTSAITQIHFAPTLENYNNLINEGVDKDNIIITGNTVIDALLKVIDENYTFENDLLNSLDFKHKTVILLTTHRRENWGEPMKNIFEAIVKIIEAKNDIEIIFPMHKNPMIRNLAYRYFANYRNRVHLIEPLEYVEFANLMSKVDIIMTDSGGIQEEAPALGKPVLVLRTETERPEAVQAGTVKLVGIETNSICEGVLELIENQKLYKMMSEAKNPYGTGMSSIKIKDAIYKKLRGKKNE